MKPPKTKRKRASVKQQKADDVLRVIAELKLEDFRLHIPPDVLRQILTRFLELIKREIERRPAHRPQSDWTGQTVDVLIENGGLSQAVARRRVAKIYRKP